MLTDFGIAKRLDDIEENLTSAGMVVGTPTYLAPEQAAGGRLGIATDVYLVGLVLDEMLTGQPTCGIGARSAACPQRRAGRGRRLPSCGRPIRIRGAASGRRRR